MKYVIEVTCDNPLVDMAVENAAEVLEREVGPWGGSVAVRHEDDVGASQAPH